LKKFCYPGFKIYLRECPYIEEGEKMAKMTGAQLTVQILKNLGVKVVVGYVGHSNQEYADALYDTPGIRTFNSRMEMTGCFIAEGYNRIVGKPEAVCIFHANGAASCLYSVANAWFDSVPLVLIAGNIHSAHKGRGALQETPLPFQLCASWWLTISRFYFSLLLVLFFIGRREYRATREYSHKHRRRDENFLHAIRNERHRGPRIAERP